MKNKVFPNELALRWDAEGQQWKRILYMFEGTYIEVDLTPRSFPKAHQKDWEAMDKVLCHWHTRKPKPVDQLFRFVIEGSPIHSAVHSIMLRGGMFEGDVQSLFATDFLPTIDMAKLRAAQVSNLLQVRHQ